MRSAIALISFLILSLACAGIPRQEPLAVSPVQPGASEGVVVDQAALLFDSSGSISKRRDFPASKALLESFVGAMPNGTYEAGAVAFGGYARQTQPLATFDRGALASFARGVSHLDEGTPIDRVLGEVQGSLEGRSKRAAVVLFSDGRPTDSVGRDVSPELSLDAARNLAASYSGEVCFHTVQVGSDAGGAAFLQALAQLTSCGTFRTAANTASADAIQRFAREVFFGAAQAPAPPMARPGDLDGDGVTDDLDQCPGTPSGARADARGCWSIPWLRFATNSAEIRPEGRQRLIDEVMPVLGNNPQLRVRIDGHTDSRGSDAYNKGLSERRSKSVEDFLVSRGVEGSRLESRGFGEEQPIAPNDTPENLQLNRRTELTILD